MSQQKQIHNEPFGHLVPETKLERYWAQCSDLVSLRRPRVMRFDPSACATYAPTVYEATTAAIRPDLPTDEWISDALRIFIRTEFAEQRARLPEPDLSSPVVTEIEVSDGILHALAKQVDSEIEEISGHFASAEDAKQPEDLARQIYTLLCHPQVGSKTNLSNVNESEFIAAVTPRIKAQERILFILLGFPFKDQNRLRVDDEADQPDLGEISFLLRLYRTTQAIYQLHPHGADILVLTDGEVYQDIFGISGSNVARYAERLKAFRSYLNLQGAVSFIPLNSLVDRASIAPHGESQPRGAKAVQQFIHERIRALIGSDMSLSAPVDHLISGMKWNHESRQLLKDLTHQEAWGILAGAKEKICPSLENRWEEFHQKAFEAAVAKGVSAAWLIRAAKAFAVEQKGNVTHRQYIKQSDDWLVEKCWQNFPEPVQGASHAAAIEAGKAATARMLVERAINGDFVAWNQISVEMAHRMVNTGKVQACDLRAQGVLL